MRDYGVVKVRFWTWAKRKKLSPAARELALYCLTSSHSNSLGFYYLPIAYIADDLGTVPDTVRQTVSELSGIGFLRHDESTSWVWVCGYLDHNPIANGNVGKSLVPLIEAIPKEIPFLQGFIASLKTHEKRFPVGFIDDMANRMGNGSPNGMPNHDQTQTHEHDQTHDHIHEHDHDHSARPQEAATVPAAQEGGAVEQQDQPARPAPPPQAEIDLSLPLALDRAISESVKLYNARAAKNDWPQCQQLTDRRRAALKARLQDIGGLEGWKVALDRVELSSFLMGKTERTGEHANWRFTFDFLLRPDHMAKLMEGGYADRIGSAGHGPRGAAAAAHGIDEA